MSKVKACEHQLKISIQKVGMHSQAALLKMFGSWMFLAFNHHYMTMTSDFLGRKLFRFLFERAGEEEHAAKLLKLISGERAQAG